MPELLSAYRFVELHDLALRRERIRARAETLGLLGTVLLADEGMNFSLGGEADALDAWVEWLAANQGIDGLTSNRQTVDRVPFLRLKVRLRPEIVTFDPELRPGRAATGEALAPTDWQLLISDEAVQVVDARNHYEVALGSFARALDPKTERFTDFRDWTLEHLDAHRPVAMFCTGGVRCEKASAWLLANGFEQVYQLEGGILSYLREIPEQQSLWQGECFVFDDRVSVDARLRPTGRPVCAGCRRPVDGLADDGMPPVDELGNCGLCDEHFRPERLAGVRERVRQIALARARGDDHLGPQATSGNARADEAEASR